MLKALPVQFTALFYLPIMLAGCSTGCTTPRQSLETSEGAHLTTHQALEIMRTVERDPPLSAQAPDLRQQAFEWVVTTKELEDMTIDARYLHELEGSWYPFKGELLMQFSFGMALHRLSRSPDATHRLAQIEAGLRSVLAAYRNILLADSKLHDAFLDQLDQKRREGNLRAFIEDVDGRAER